MLVTSKEMLEKARREHYAVPAMNTQGGNYDIIWAICRAAEEMHSPAILAHYVATGAYSGDDWFVEVCKWCANKVSVPKERFYFPDDRRLHKTDRRKCQTYK